MADAIAWYRQVDAASERFEDSFPTTDDVQRAIDDILGIPDCPYEGLVFNIVRNAPFQTITIGREGLGGPTDTHTLHLNNRIIPSCQISLWGKADDYQNSHAIDLSLANAHLDRFFQSFFKMQLRDDKSRLISFHVPDRTRAIFSATLSRQIVERPAVCVYFCDIDHFGDLNNTYGQQMGDTIILQVAAILEQVIGPHGVALHRSGDEFAVLLPVQDVSDGLAVAQVFLQQVMATNFSPDPSSSIKITASLGIAVVSKADEQARYEDLERRAERALKPEGLGKQRGRARLEPKPVNRLLTETSPDVLRSIALCIAKGHVGSACPFASPWLNLISRNVSESIRRTISERTWSLNDLQRDIDQLLAWIDPIWEPNAMRASAPSEYDDDYQVALSPIDVAFAAAHGVLRGSLGISASVVDMKSLSLRAHHDGSVCALVLEPDNKILMQYGEEREGDVYKIELGGFITAENTDVIDRTSAQHVVLIRIGHTELPIPESIFVRTIIVDDRPTRGGGLPDFWEMTVARLIGTIEENANVSAVCVFGERDYGKQTVSKLADIDAWQRDTAEIAYKTGMPLPSIEASIHRIRSNVYFPDDVASLVSHVAATLLPPVVLRTGTNTVRSRRHFLRRETQMDTMALRRTDGCRVGTAAEAFPVVVDLLRQEDHAVTFVDGTGNSLKEVIDFRVHLSSPLLDPVPAFYERETDSLGQYFQREFVDANGIFRHLLDKAGQIDALLNHVMDVLNQDGQPSATRRAVLVVPNIPSPGNELAPVGLVSVWIAPRLLHGRIRLHFSYTWRTVEVLVGFPYSLFGSIRFSEYLTEAIRDRLNPPRSHQIELGELSYIAHSLHMYTDEYAEIIARQIVNDASL